MKKCLAIKIQPSISILQEICQITAFTCKILQECLPESCKICVFPNQGNENGRKAVNTNC